MDDRVRAGDDGGWFRALLDSGSEVYFRYRLQPTRGFEYVSPSVEALTGHTADDFLADAAHCMRLVSVSGRRVLRQALRARRGLTLSLTLTRSGIEIPLRVRTAVVIRQRQLVAIEGVATPLPGAQRGGVSATSEHPLPVQQRLAALLYEVHDLLHLAPPSVPAPARRLTRLGELVFDHERLVVTEAERPVALTSREMLVLRYLLQSAGRVVTREQLLTEVWGYAYTGDDRTVDVHVSRLRRKLPSLRDRLVALRNIGYRLVSDTDLPQAAGE